MEQIEKEKIQSNKGSSYKLLVEQAKLKQATSKVRLIELLSAVHGFVPAYEESMCLCARECVTTFVKRRPEQNPFGCTFLPAAL